MKRNYTFSKALQMNTLLLLSLIFLNLNASAQTYNEVNRYQYSEVNNAGTYAFLTSGTDLDSGANNTNTFYTNINIGFDFRFNNQPGGTVYSKLGIHTNGFVWFGAGTPGTSSSAPIATNGNIGGTGSVEGVISAYADYAGTLSSYSNSSYIRYATQGSAPNRKFIVEWNAYQNPNGFHGTNSPTFRITLYEEGTVTPAGYSNKIEIQHLNHTPVFIANLYLVQIGLRGMTNTDFKALTTPNCPSTYWNNIASSTTVNTSTVAINGTLPCSMYLNTPSARFDFIPPTDSCQLYANYTYTSNDSGEVSFTNISYDSTLGGGGIFLWTWSFQDGTPSSYIGQTPPKVQYTNTGDYSVCLKIMNAKGCTNSICNNIHVKNDTLPSSHSLCVAVFPQDSSFAFPGQETEIYLIKAYSTSGGDSLAAVQSVIRGTTTVAYYCFDSIPDGTYYVKAALTPNAPRYLDYMPTYYNLNLLWNGATPINLNSQQYITFPLIKGLNTAGPGFVGGYVSQGANRLEAASGLPGDPLADKRVLLTTESGEGIGHILSDANGQYSFSGLAYGIYKLWIDELNKECEPVTVVISPAQESFDNVNFQVGSHSIAGGFSLSNNGISEGLFEAAILGNPAGSELVMLFNNIKEEVSVTISDVLGRKLISEVKSETALVKLNISNLSSGIYLVSAVSGNEKRTLKLVKN